MPADISFDSETGLIVLRSSGDVTINDWIMSRQRISGLCEQFNCRKVLIDVTKQVLLRCNWVDVFNFGAELKYFSPLSTVRFAIVTKVLSDSHDLLVRTANIRGMNFKVFNDYAPAIEWLCQNGVRAEKH